jgi:hypothetical protein
VDPLDERAYVAFLIEGGGDDGNVDMVWHEGIPIITKIRIVRRWAGSRRGEESVHNTLVDPL